MKKRSLVEHNGPQRAEKRAAPKHFHHALRPVPDPKVPEVVVEEQKVVKTGVQLNPHCFGSILAFLKLDDFLAAARSCKDWNELASMCVPRREYYSLNRETEQEMLHNLIKSPLRHHVSRLNLTGICTENSVSTIALVTAKLTHVVELRCSLNASSNPLYIVWPSKLTSLTVRLLNVHASVCTTFVQTMIRDCSSLVSFTLDHSASLITTEGVALLQTLPKLTHLCIHSKTEADVAIAVRGFPYLKKLNLPDMSSMLRDLCTKERSLPAIKHLVNKITIDMLNVQYLIRLNTLTELDCSFTSANVAETTFKHLPNLVDLRMDHRMSSENKHFTEEETLKEHRDEVRALRHCPQLRELVMHQNVNSDDLADTLVLLHNLEGLGIVGNHVLSSLKFLSVLNSKVEYLRLFECRNIPVFEFGYIRTMHQLDQLHIEDSFSGPFDDFTIATVTPHSQWFDKQAWPNLNSFTYSYEKD